MKAGVMRTAKAGEELSPRAAAKLRSRTRFFEELLSTKKGCTIQAKTNAKFGQWVCVDCGAVFQNNMGAHMHVKSHRKAWWTGLQFEEP